MIVMWQVRLRMRVARPRARGRQRFSVGPSSAKHAETNRASGSWPSLLVALATADARPLRITLEMSRSVNCGTSPGARRMGIVMISESKRRCARKFSVSTNSPSRRFGRGACGIDCVSGGGNGCITWG